MGLVSHLAFYFGSVRCRLLVLYCAPSVVAWWLQIKVMQSKSHSLYQCFVCIRILIMCGVYCMCACLHICLCVRHSVDE